MNISSIYLKQCAKIACFIGDAPDWVQGGGGNFSIKIDGKMMLIKASGLSLKEVQESHGIVLVDYLSVKKYYNSLFGKKITVQMENLSNEVILGLTSNFLANQNLKASIETGFHAFLKKYIVHSHSVYANIVNCSSNPEKLLKKIFINTNFEYVVVAYQAPGLCLANQIRKSVDAHIKEGKNWPEVIFLQNHGIIINTDKFDRCLNLYLQVDKLLKKYFNFKSAYPKILIKKSGNAFQSRTTFLMNYFDKYLLDKNLFQPILFPDQVVYLNSKIVSSKYGLWLGDKLYIDKKTNKITYFTNRKESAAIEETMLSYCYIKEESKRLKLKLKKITKADVNFINKMESEKYRQKLLKK